ncbi:MAG: hypothetical protein ACE1ZA_22745, partial [Pseudomonadales bacterium]
SGTHQDAKLCLAAGYIASVDTWQAFDRRWRLRLSASGVPDFHAEAFFGRDKNGKRRRLFQHLTHRQASDLISDLATIIHDTDVNPIKSSVHVADFVAFTEDERRYLTGAYWDGGKLTWTISGSPHRPFYLPFQHVILGALEHSDGAEPVDFTFDQHNVLYGYMRDLYNQLRARSTRTEHADMRPLVAKMGQILEGKRQSDPALQASDLLAYCWYRRGLCELNDEPLPRDLRQCLAVLSRKSNTMVLFDRARMQRNLDAVPLSIRDGSADSRRGPRQLQPS